MIRGYWRSWFLPPETFRQGPSLALLDPSRIPLPVVAAQHRHIAFPSRDHRERFACSEGRRVFELAYGRFVSSTVSSIVFPSRTTFTCTLSPGALARRA